MSDPTERDRTLSRVRTTTAVTGIGVVLAGGALAGWLGHAESTASTGTADPSSSTSDSSSSSSSSSDDGLTSPTTAPGSDSGSDSGTGTQPGVTSGGS
jgi:hypothetical protein